MTITAKNNKEKNTYKESVNRKITGRHYLDIIEERRISVLKLGYLSQMLYALLIEKYIYFFNENKLNSKGEFFQTYDDFKLKLRAGNLSDHLVRKGLDELIKKGFIARNKKFPEGVRNGILKYHYTLNFEKLDNIIITPEEYKLPNKKKYEIQQDIKYAHSTTDKPKAKTVEITDNTDNKPNATKTLKSIEDDSELVGIGDFENDISDSNTNTIDSTPVIKPNDNKTDIKTIEPDVKPEILSNDDSNDDILDNKTDSETIKPAVEPDVLFNEDTPKEETIEPDVEPEILSNEDTPIIPAVKGETLPNEPDKLIDDNITTDKMIEDKIINNNDDTTKTNEIMKMNETPNEISTNETTDFNERTKLLMKYKNHEGIKPVIDDTRLSFQTINYLYSSEYKKGLDEKLDNHKATLDILHEIRIKPLIDK